MKKRVLSLLLVIVFAFSSFPFATITVSASTSYTEPTIVVESKYIAPNSQVEVKVDVENNPGVAGATLGFSYDPKLTLVSAKNGDAFAKLSYTAPGKFTNPCEFFWDSATGQADDDGTILYLTFKVSDEAVGNDNLNINVSYYPGDIYNEDFESLKFQMVNGCITVIDYIPGDVNGDGVVTGKDITLIRRNIVSGYETEINESAADVNDDGRINGKDINLIRRFIVGGYGVELSPSKPKCEHTMSATAYKAATCTKDGNIAYWHCSLCDKYFSDAEGTTEITLENTVIPATDHTEVIDPAVPATETSTGLTEGSHCSVCNTVIVEQKPTPMLEPSKYAITYNIANSDNYLQRLTIDNPNADSYDTKKGLVLKSLNVDGYNFKGWYTAQTGGTRVTEIPAGTKGTKELFAQWEKVEYTVTFDSPDVPWDSIKYTVDRGATLTNPSWFGYTFIGWSLDGEIVSIIPPGTTGNITLHANWTSDRNKAKSVGTLASPNIIEDMDNGQYLFLYELGTIENVPLSQIEYIGNSQGVVINEEYEYSQKIGEGYADTIAKAVSNATTKTSAWTLSEDWNKTTSATNEHDEEIGKTESKTDSEGNVVGSKYYVSNSAGGSTSSSSSGGGSNSSSAKVTQGSSTGINGSYTSETETSSSVKLSTEASVSTGLKAEYLGIEASVSSEISASEETEDTRRDKNSSTIASSRTHNVGTENLSSGESHWDTSSSSSSNWNTTNSYENSSTTSINTEVSKAISQVISDRYSYTSTNSEGGSNSSTQSTGETQELTNEYASTIEYSVEETKTVKKTIEKKSDATGYYRLVNAGTVHVFGVVGYNIATNSYFTYTYNVLDKERHEYLDYSKDNANFNDCENAILPFEIPYFVHEYISTKIARSAGLTVDTDTGVITEYDDNGKSENVIVPEYVSVKNGNNTYSAIRIRGIKSDTFKGNTNIKGVYLPKYVYQIPDNAFEGCTSLETVGGYGISEIGKEVFKNCTSLNRFVIDKNITALGNGAFENVLEAEVSAVNENVANGAIASKAKRISLDISNMKDSFDNRKITVANSTDYFAIMSNDSSYKNLQIDSEAKETLISNMIFTDNIDTPLKLNSEIVTLSKVTVQKAPGFALILPDKNTELKLFGRIDLSTSGENVIISKNVALAKVDAQVAGTLKLTGNYLVCGEIGNSKMLEFVSGNVVNITDEQFETYLTSSVITFDANGGALEESTKSVYYGQAYGELPQPTRENYDFAGWYTAKSDGTKITADTIVNSLVNQTLYAQWTPKNFTITFNANEGSVDTNSKIVVYGAKYGDLPIPNKDYHDFLGWFTQAENGEEVTAETVATTSENITLYAHWKEKPISGWVLASDVPADGEVVNAKWNYTLREHTANSASELFGWVKYDTQRTSWGAWSGWSTANPSNGVRNVESRSVYDHTEYHYYRWTNGKGYVYSYKYSSAYWLEEKWFTYILPTSKDGSCIGYVGSDGGDRRWVRADASINHSVDKTWTRTINRTEWRYQDPVYTYYYYRDLAKESTTDPTGQSNVSNVVKWVQYRVK